ncbi:hypothetical protein JKP88DRAFT_290445 [Tribonema minus]|uniref:Uncharacterized protein n=1 Tax=Tribonema minus TaxID=303371 RepID=A0A835Z1H8_9STRA|nr:hypothetical protein JKP88DRAFT_290445 [Tribonema minus]
MSGNVRSRVLQHARYGFTFTQIATCLQQLRSGSNDAASALALLLPSVWYQDWRQDDGAWRALRDLLQRAGGAAGPGMRTRAGAHRAAAPAVAREPGSAQAPPAAVLPRRQAALSRVLDAALAATQLRRLEAANALEAVAAWRSGASKGAMGFLAQLPSTDPAETMSPPEFRETLRRHLGVERPAPAAARCPKCHKPVDSGAHLRRCTQGLNVTRHNLLADALFQLLKQVAHLRGLDRDTLAPFRRYAARHGFNKFMDIVFGSNQICLPVPKVQPSADAAQGGARDVQRVLESASQEKIDTYVVSGALDPTTHTLFSAAFDHFGAMSRDTQALLHALAEQGSHGSYNLAQRVAVWRRRTSLALQRALTRVVIDNWNAVIAPDGDHPFVAALPALLPGLVTDLYQWHADRLNTADLESLAHPFWSRSGGGGAALADGDTKGSPQQRYRSALLPSEACGADVQARRRSSACADAATLVPQLRRGRPGVAVLAAQRLEMVSYRYEWPQCEGEGETAGEGEARVSGDGAVEEMAAGAAAVERWSATEAHLLVQC